MFITRQKYKAQAVKIFRLVLQSRSLQSGDAVRSKRQGACSVSGGAESQGHTYRDTHAQTHTQRQTNRHRETHADTHGVNKQKRQKNTIVMCTLLHSCSDFCPWPPRHTDTQTH